MSGSEAAEIVEGWRKSQLRLMFAGGGVMDAIPDERQADAVAFVAALWKARGQQ